MSKYISDNLVQCNISTNTSVGISYTTITKESYLQKVNGKDYVGLSIEDSQKYIQQYIDLLIDTNEKLEKVLQESYKRIDEFAEDLQTIINNKDLVVRETHAVQGQTVDRELKIMKARLTKMVYSFLPNLPSNEWELAGVGKFVKRTKQVWKETSNKGFYCGNIPVTEEEPDIIGVSSAWSAYTDKVVNKVKSYFVSKLAVKVGTNEEGHAFVKMYGRVIWQFIEAKEIEYKEFEDEILEF